jgi:tRNA dimethylallyltransferase
LAAGDTPGRGRDPEVWPNGHGQDRRARVDVIALFGPTGVGKTEVAIALAERLRERGEAPIAISADALQVYRGLEALTGAATAEERARLEHRLISFVPVSETFSAGEFAALAHAEIDAALAAGRRPIVVGGTGLYLQAALTDLELRPPPEPELRARVEAVAEARGPESLHAELTTRAPRVAAAIAPTDRARVIRALELLEMGEEPAPTGDDSRLWTANLRHPTLLCGLVMERTALYRRTDARVEEMIAAGAAEEVRRADAAGASRTARKALGFEELLNGDIEAMKRRTRNYAKRQLAWLRRLPGLVPVEVNGRSPEQLARTIDSALSAGS